MKKFISIAMLSVALIGCQSGSNDDKNNDSSSDGEDTAESYVIQESEKPAKREFTGLEVGKTYTFTMNDMGFTSHIWPYGDGLPTDVDMAKEIHKLTGVNLTVTFRIYNDRTIKYDISQQVTSDAWKADEEYSDTNIPFNFTATQIGSYTFDSDLEMRTYTQYDEKYEYLSFNIPSGSTDGETPLVFYNDPEHKEVLKSIQDNAFWGSFRQVKDGTMATADFFVDRDFNVYNHNMDVKHHTNPVAKLQVK